LYREMKVQKVTPCLWFDTMRLLLVLSIILLSITSVSAQFGLRDALKGGGLRGDDLDEGGAPDNFLPMPKDMKVERDVAYGKDPLQKIDIYLPAECKNAPIIMMVHGGGWRRGDKSGSRVVNNKVAHWLPKGVIFISVNNRMVPTAYPVEQAADVASALGYVQSNASSWGGDPNRIVLMGHSAGAHLVALLASDKELVAKEHAKPWLGTVVLDSAAMDVVQRMKGPHFGLYDQAFLKDPNYWSQASPVDRLTSAPKPILLVCSSQRKDSPAQVQIYANKATKLGGRAIVLPEDLNHGGINSNLGLPGAYTDAVDSFLHSVGLF